MRYCKKCVMPSTRPGIVFNEEGICSGCISEKRKDSVDWDGRKKELEVLCDKYRGLNGDFFDCIIAISGGKDSHFQVHVMKEVMGMHPLLVTVEDHFTMTEAGKHNLKNISEVFSCDIISLKPNIKNQKTIMRYCFENYAKPTYYTDRLIYTYPIWMAVKLNIPLVVYGENTSYEYGGPLTEETYSAKEQINNTAASGISIDELSSIMYKEIKGKELYLLNYPSHSVIESVGLEPIFLSYFYRWNDYGNYVLAKRKGFKNLTGEWRRTHHIDDYTQVDSMAYGVHYWLKYPKFGHQYATDLASRFIKVGLLNRQEAIELVKKHDHALDQKCIDDFCNFCGYTLKEFWEIVDKFYNKDLFEKDKFGRWVLKDPIWKQEEMSLIFNSKLYWK